MNRAVAALQIPPGPGEPSSTRPAAFYWLTGKSRAPARRRCEGEQMLPDDRTRV